MVTELEKYLDFIQPQTPGLKKARRESASVIDEFFGEPKTLDNLLGKSSILSRHQAAGDNFLAVTTTPSTVTTTTKMLDTMDKQALFEQNVRRESSSVVEEFFSFAEPGDKILRAVAAPHALSSSWIKREPAEEKDMDVFDITSTIYDSVVVPDLGSSNNSGLPAAGNTSSSLWEDISASMNVIDNVETLVASSMGTTPSCSGKVKAEPMDTSDKPSCVFSNKPMSARTHNGGLVMPFSSQSGVAVPSPPSSSSSDSISMNRMAYQGHFKSPLHPQHQHNHNHFASPTPPASSSAAAVVPCVFLPPTPPSSQPASPSNVDFTVRRTPPPPYPGMVTSAAGAAGVPQGNIPRPVLSCSPALPVPLPAMPSSSSVRARPNKPQNTHPGCSTIKYNRKNNPELEKRRIHFCSFPGENRLAATSLSTSNNNSHELRLICLNYGRKGEKCCFELLIIFI